MTEAEWLACADPKAMLEHLRGRASPHKARLFAGACARRVWHLLTDKRVRRALDLAEGYAAGLATEQEWQAARAAISRLIRGLPQENGVRSAAWAADHVGAFTDDYEPGGADFVAYHVRQAAYYHALQAAGSNDRAAFDAGKRAADAERAAQVALLHDIYGNPFRRASAESARLTADVLALARAAYEERQLPSGHLDPQRLSVLADALEEAGWAAADLLAHLRSPGPHVRGCWSVDLALGKE